jgi:uncharacterized protein
MENLNQILGDYGSCGIAFSGGVDSTFLLAAAGRRLGKNNVKAYTVIPPYVADWEIDEAEEFTRQMDMRHAMIKVPMPELVRNNPENRCYVCKHALFTLMKKAAAADGLHMLCDGSNQDDLGDYRPGMKALKELEVQSPLLQAGLTKDDIRKVSKEWELSTWDKPPYACLLTRIPHNEEVTTEILDRIEKSELYIMSLGFRHIRVRHHGELARIEIPSDRIAEFLEGDTAEKVYRELKKNGYTYVSLDLGGYRIGNMNMKRGGLSHAE